MVNTTARFRAKGKEFEIIVDLDKALSYKKTGKGSSFDFLEIDKVFSDSKKGLNASGKDLIATFGTDDVRAVAEKIVKQGEVQVSTEHKEKERQDKIKQVVAFISKNAVNPQTGLPYTPEKIEASLKQAGVNIENKPIEMQINSIIEKLAGIIPIKISTKKIKITVPAIYTGQVYGLLQQYKESEEWLSNGDLKCTISLPAGLQLEFYDKLNAVTHGAVLTEEVKERK